MSTSAKLEITLDPPGIAGEAEVTLAPTRSKVLGVSALAPAGASVRAEQEFRYRVCWSPTGRELRVRLCVEYEGEPPHVMAVRWGGGSGVAIMGTPAEKDWQTIYDFREKLTDPEQCFLFELDRQTNPNLITLAKDIGADVRARRMLLLGSVMPQLKDRLELRRRGRVGRIEAITPGELLMHFSGVFARSTIERGVGANWGEVGCTLERFAAGDLHLQVPVVRDGRTIKIGMVEPDSYFVFYFAEFALAALDDGACAEHHDMWKGLLPSLVKMQRYFLRRFSTRSCVTGYGEPVEELDPRARADVDAQFLGKGSDRATQEAMMKENLGLVLDCF